MRCPDGAGGRSEVALVASSPPLSLPGDLSVSQAGTAQPAAGQCWPGPSRGSPPPAGRTLRPAALTPGRAQRFWRSGRAQRGAGGGPDSARPGTAETVPPSPGLGTTGMAPGLGLQRCDSSCHCPWAFCPPLPPARAQSCPSCLASLGGLWPPTRALSVSPWFPPLSEPSLRRQCQHPLSLLCWPRGPPGLAFCSLDLYGSSPESAGAFSIPFPCLAGSVTAQLCKHLHPVPPPRLWAGWDPAWPCWGLHGMPCAVPAQGGGQRWQQVVAGWSVPWPVPV